MARATGRRLIAALCFLIGGITVVGAPVLWPIGYIVYKSAKEKEKEAEKRQEFYEQNVDQVQG